jgi:methionine synthase I (cobalamin-dependent)/5,10-methylenetetrahydrofolate reductase
MNIREYLKKRRLVMDGAMGTYYAGLNQGESLVSEYANLNDAQTILKIHTSYINEGAGLIKTNTFACYRQTLGENADVSENVRAAVKIAKKAAEGKDIFIAGDLGPISSLTSESEEEQMAEYKNNIDIFIDEKLPVILFETFSDEVQVIALAQYIKTKSPDTFVIAQFCLNQNGFTNGGTGAKKICNDMLDSDFIDAFGFNCGIGASNMFRIAEEMDISSFTKYFCVSPNAGYPELSQNRIVFMHNIEYFTEYMEKLAQLGAAVIGSCCGTTPEYTKKINDFAGLLPPVSLKERKKQCVDIVNESLTAAKTASDKNIFMQKCLSGRKVNIVELDPPYDGNDQKMMQQARELSGYDVDMITIADSPQGKSRIDSVLMSVKVMNITGMSCMPHLCCRDRNLISMRGTLLGAYANGIRNILAVTGDPIPSESRSSTTGVFDYDSVKLMQFITGINDSYFACEPFVFGGALNQGRLNLKYEIERVKKKMQAGAAFFLTQPVYSKEDIERIDRIRNETGALVMCGIMPLVSYRNAYFVQNELAGINVPDDVIKRYSPDMSKEEAQAVGQEISKELIKQLDDIANGYFFMLPFNRISLLNGIIGNK